MIDIENDVFDTVAKALRAAHSGIYVTGEAVPIEAKLPAVSIVEADNRVAERYRTTTEREFAANVMFEVNIYSDKAAGKKSEAKAIAHTVDNTLAELGFTRTMRNQVPNFNDTRIYRIVCRYEATVDKDLWIYDQR